jgi:hypothetical protein
MHFGEDGKLGEIKLDDTHTLLVFPKEDREYVQTTYIDRLVSYNNIIDEIITELIYRKKEIDRMVHYKDNKKLLWGYGHETSYVAAGAYQNFTRLETQLDNVLKERVGVMQEFHEAAMRFHNDQTIQDKKFSPIDSAEKADLVTSPGLAKAAQQITNETFKKWEFYGLGRSLNPVYFDQDKLVDQIARFYIKSHGSFAAIGDVIRLLIISPGDLPTEDIGELCVANALDGGEIFFRVVMDKLVHHDADNNFLCNSSNVYLVSRR